MSHVWHRLSPEQAHEGYFVPQNLAYDDRNRFFTSCAGGASVPADAPCEFVGLVAHAPDGGLVTLYLGGFSLADLYDLYGVETVESGAFNVLEGIDGHISFNKELGLGLAEVLRAYASQMAVCETVGACAFEPLDGAAIERYHISTYAHHEKEVYRLTCSSAPDWGATTLVSFTRAADRPTVQGMGVTRFSENEIQGSPRFRPFVDGAGAIPLTREALLALASMVEERAACLQTL
ncbi:MAG: hypothetical protein ACLFU8_15430 [Anaerolineales bacterium]